MKKFLVVDDHKMFIDGIRLVLDQTESLRVADFALNGKEAVKKISEGTFDYILMDISMPEMNGIEAVKEIRKADKKIKIIMVTMLHDYSSIAKALKAGANGFLLKDTGADEIMEAVRHVERGENYLSEPIRKMVLEILAMSPDEQQSLSDPAEILTPREKEIVKLVAGGLTTQMIAGKLFLSEKTVETHRKNILHKLKLGNTAALVKFASENGLV